MKPHARSDGRARKRGRSSLGKSIKRRCIGRRIGGHCIAAQPSLSADFAGAGAVAQMGERCNRTAEVRGSIPLSSTSHTPIISQPCVGIGPPNVRLPHSKFLTPPIPCGDGQSAGLPETIDLVKPARPIGSFFAGPQINSPPVVMGAGADEPVPAATDQDTSVINQQSALMDAAPRNMCTKRSVDPTNRYCAHSGKSVGAV